MCNFFCWSIVRIVKKYFCIVTSKTLQKNSCKNLGLFVLRQKRPFIYFSLPTADLKVSSSYKHHKKARVRVQKHNKFKSTFAQEKKIREFSLLSVITEENERTKPTCLHFSLDSLWEKAAKISLGDPYLSFIGAACYKRSCSQRKSFSRAPESIQVNWKWKLVAVKREPSVECRLRIKAELLSSLMSGLSFHHSRQPI